MVRRAVYLLLATFLLSSCSTYQYIQRMNAHVVVDRTWDKVEREVSLSPPMAEREALPILPITPTLYGCEGYGDLRLTLEHSLSITEGVLRLLCDGHTQIPNEAIPITSVAWKQRLSLLYLLGRLDEAKSDARFCLAHYQHPSLRAIAYEVAIQSALVTGQIAAADSLLPLYLHEQPHRSAQKEVRQLQAQRAVATAAHAPETTRLLTALVNEEHHPLLRFSLLRRQADLLLQQGDSVAALTLLQRMQRELPISIYAPYHTIEVALLSRRDFSPKELALLSSSMGTVPHLRTHAMRRLREAAYARGDLLEALSWHRRMATDRTPLYQALLLVEGDLHLIDRYRRGADTRRPELPPLPPDPMERGRSFVEVWGMIPNEDFWGMEGGAGALHPTYHDDGRPVDHATYKAALQRVEELLRKLKR